MMTLDSKRPVLRASDYYQTPEHILDAVRGVGPIVLDPCASADNCVGARFAFTEAGPVEGRGGWARDTDDGLSISWAHATGLVFVNPPYSPGHLPVWVRRCIAEAVLGVEIVALLPANTDVRWFQDLDRTGRCVAGSADAICFLRGRQRFIDPATGAVTRGGGRFASMAVYWGSRDAAFEKHFEPLGAIWRL